VEERLPRLFPEKNKNEFFYLVYHFKNFKLKINKNKNLTVAFFSAWGNRAGNRLETALQPPQISSLVNVLSNF